MNNTSEFRDSKGTYQRWDLTRYSEYRRANTKDPQDNPNYPNHPLFNRIFKYAGKSVQITKVVKHWWAGYYYLAVYEILGTRSHGTVVIENINSINDDILDNFSWFKNRFIQIKE